VLGIVCALLFNIALFYIGFLNIYTVQIFIIFIAIDFITIVKFQSLFNHSLIVEHLDCFQLCAITNKVAVNIFAQVDLKAIFFR